MKAVSVEEAVALIPNGANVMVAGFMGVGTPERLLDELVRQRKSELSFISNDATVPGKGVGKLFDAALVSTLTTSHIGLNPNVQKQMMANGCRRTADQRPARRIRLRQRDVVRIDPRRSRGHNDPRRPSGRRRRNPRKLDNPRQDGAGDWAARWTW
jgi:hypothetical protein